MQLASGFMQLTIYFPNEHFEYSYPHSNAYVTFLLKNVCENVYSMLRQRSQTFLSKKCYVCIRMGITVFKMFIGEVYRRIYVRKSRFTAPLTRRRKTKFPTVYPTIYLPKCKFLIQLSPYSNALANATRRLIG